LAGLERDLGVIVEDDQVADLRSSGANIVLVAAADVVDENFEVYQRFLDAGINVLSAGSHAYQPELFYPDHAAKMDALAKERGVSFTGSGIWDMTRIWSGILAGGACVEIESIDYSTDTEVLRQGIHWLEPTGIGMTVEEFDEKVGRVPSQLSDVIQIPSILVLRQYGYTIDNVEMSQEPVLFDEPVYCRELEKELPAGTCVGTRTMAVVDTVEGVQARSRFEYRLLRPGEVEHSTWKINGSPGMEVRVVREDSDVAQASSLVNRIPDVLAAEPGITPITDMGPLKPSTLLASA